MVEPMIRIPGSIYRKMVEHAKKEKPLECCGLLAGKDQTVQEIFETQNAARSPILFSMDPKEELMALKEIENQSMEIVAIYHSHPHTIPFPSEADVKMSFSFDVPLVIISLKERNDSVVKAFQIRKEAIYLEEIEVI
jgi:proteasome lid subunit RPN8/RPN11